MAREVRNIYGLTRRREAFCHEMAERVTDSAVQCYKTAFPSSIKWKGRTVNRRITELMGNDLILKRIETLRNAICKRAPGSKEEAIGVLTSLWRDENNNPLERMAAIRLSCDMLPGWKVNKDNDDKPAPSAVQVIIVNNHEQAKELQELQTNGSVMKLPPPLELPVKNVAKQVAAQVKGYEVPKRKR